MTYPWCAVMSGGLFVVAAFDFAIAVVIVARLHSDWSRLARWPFSRSGAALKQGQLKSSVGRRNEASGVSITPPVNSPERLPDNGGMPEDMVIEQAGDAHGQSSFGLSDIGYSRQSFSRSVGSMLSNAYDVVAGFFRTPRGILCLFLSACVFSAIGWSTFGFVWISMWEGGRCSGEDEFTSQTAFAEGFAGYFWPFSVGSLFMAFLAVLSSTARTLLYGHPSATKAPPGGEAFSSVVSLGRVKRTMLRAAMVSRPLNVIGCLVFWVSRWRCASYGFMLSKQFSSDHRTASARTYQPTAQEAKVEQEYFQWAGVSEFAEATLLLLTALQAISILLCTGQVIRDTLRVAVKGGLGRGLLTDQRRKAIEDRYSRLFLTAWAIGVPMTARAVIDWVTALQNVSGGTSPFWNACNKAGLCFPTIVFFSEPAVMIVVLWSFAKRAKRTGPDGA